MDALNRITLVDQAETALRQAFQNGQFDDRVPGIRQLAATFGAHHITVAEAVARLVADGTLLSNGPRRRFTISQGGTGHRKNREKPLSRKVLFLTYDQLHETEPVALEILSHLLMQRPDWDIRHRMAGRSDGRSNQRYWDGLIKSEEAEHLVVFAGRPSLAKWSLDRGVPTYFLGGDSDGLAVPMLGVNAARMIQTVIRKLVALGHSRICQPICGMPEGFCERQRRSIAECFDEHGLPFVPGYHVPIISRQDPTEFARALVDVIKTRPPTALVLFSWDHFVTAACVLRDHGLKIPKDVSIVIMSQERAMGWHLPRLAHFEYPVEHVAGTLAKWIEIPPKDLRSSVSLPLRLIEEDSLAPPSH